MSRALSALAALAAVGAAGPLAAETYKWGMPPDGWPPYVMKKAKERPGIYPEIMEKIGAITGHSFPYEPIPPERGRRYFKRGKLAIEVMVSPSWYGDDPPDFTRFTEPVMRSDDVLVFPEGESFAYGGDPAELSGMKIATIQGYRYPGTDNFQRVDVNDEKQVLRIVERGRVPAGIVNEHVGGWFAQQMDAEVAFGPTYTEANLAIHVHEDYVDPLLGELNAAIAQLKEQGEIQPVIDKYLGE